MKEQLETSISGETVRGRAALFHIFSIDLGFLLEPNGSGRPAVQDLVAARADGSIGARFSDGPPGTGTMASRVSEFEDIQKRAEKAQLAQGRSIWSATILRREAPYVMEFPANANWTWRAPAGRQSVVALASSPPKLRLFRRGSISLTFRHDFEPDPGSPISVDDFVDALGHLTGDLEREAHSHMVNFLGVARDSNHSLAGIDVVWRSGDENARSIVSNSLVQHSLFFLEAALGFDPIVPGEEQLDPDSHAVGTSVAATLDTNKLRDRYDRSYTQELLARANRWRDDELYVTEHRRSLVILADYWREGDSLRFYMEDLVLATAFELAKITYLRFLAEFLEYAAPTVDILDGDANERRRTLVFVQLMQDAVRRANYDDPTEDLILHKFTSRFLEGISEERGTSLYIDSMRELTDRIAQRIHIQATVTIAERTLASARNTLIISMVAATVGLVSVCASLLIFLLS